MNSKTKTSVLVQKVWQYAHVLKDDGLAFMDYTEQITYLLFLKMAAEQGNAAGGNAIPARYSWNTLKGLRDNGMRWERYHQGLRKLSERPGLIGQIFARPQSRIRDPAKLNLLMQMIDGENWSALDVDVKGQVYEGLLARNAEDVRGGAGQYFTPRAVIQAIVAVMRPQPMMHILDPACGTGGFLLAAFDYLAAQALTAEQMQHVRSCALHGNELVPNVARLCAMNLFLRGIAPDPERPAVTVSDSLEQPALPVDMILTNPPFGRKSSFIIMARDGKQRKERFAYQRHDFWATTSNKQLNFVQHVYASLKDDGCAAVVVPDNVLFEAGAGERIRRALLSCCEVHTLLRLPVGIWYAPGVQANVLFFNKTPPATAPASTFMWIYDLRSGQNFSLRQKPIEALHLDDFVRSYCAEDRSQRQESPLFKRFSYAEILARDKAGFDIQWQDPALLCGRQVNATALMHDILKDLREAVQEFSLAVNDGIRNEHG